MAYWRQKFSTKWHNIVRYTIVTTQCGWCCKNTASQYKAAEIFIYPLYLSPCRCAPGTCAGSGGPIHRCTWRRSEERAELDTGAWWGCSWRCKHRRAPPGSGAVSRTGHAAGIHLGDLRSKTRTKEELKRSGWTKLSISDSIHAKNTLQLNLQHSHKKKKTASKLALCRPPPASTIPPPPPSPWNKTPLAAIPPHRDVFLKQFTFEHSMRNNTNSKTSPNPRPSIPPSSITIQSFTGSLR